MVGTDRGSEKTCPVNQAPQRSSGEEAGLAGDITHVTTAIVEIPLPTKNAVVGVPKLSESQILFCRFFQTSSPDTGEMRRTEHKSTEG